MSRRNFSRKAEVLPFYNLKASFICVPENLESAVFIKATSRQFWSFLGEFFFLCEAGGLEVPTLIVFM